MRLSRWGSLSLNTINIFAWRRLGPQFSWLWAAFAVSAFGTWIAFDAFPLIAILALHAAPAQVSFLAAAGLAVGAVVAVPLGPWVERRRKRRVMIAMDALRFIALLSIPLAYALGALTFAQLVLISIVVGACNIAFRAASGACLKSLVPAEDLLVANGRFESTTWTATALGPPLGGAAIGLFGPVITVVADAASYLLSAFGILAIGGHEARPAAAGTATRSARELLEGWRFILSDRTLRPLFFNTVLVNALIMATAPLLAVLMLSRLGFKPWQYGLAFGVPCIGGLIGARLSRPLLARFGERRIMRATGTLRACWSIGLAFIPSGIAGIAAVMIIELALITCMGVFNPVFATFRLNAIPADRVARVLSAWTISSSITVAAMTAFWGLLATAAGLRVAIAAAGILMLATPLLLFARTRETSPAP